MDMIAWLKRTFQSGKHHIAKIYQDFSRMPLVRFLYNVAQTLGKDYVGIMAAGLSYYAFLSLFPLLVGLISILGFLLPSESVYNTIFNFLRENIPASTEILESNIKNIIELRGTLGLISIGGLIFGASAVFGAISLAINRAWDLWPRPLWIRKPLEIAMVLAMGLIIILLLGISTGLSLLNNLMIPGINIIQPLISRGGSFLLIAAVFLLLYKFIPNTHMRWGDIWRGAFLGAAMFQLALYGFAFFLNNFAQYQVVYGSLASLVIILVWIYVSSFILILCAEINAVYYRMFGKSH